MLRRHVRGFTIIEVSVVIGLLAMLTAGVFGIFVHATRTYAVLVMRGVAQHEATQSTGRLRDLLRMSVEITENGQNHIQFHLMPWDALTDTAKLEPAGDADFGPEVRVYRSDESGSVDAEPGRYLWVATRNGGAWSDRTLVSERVSDLRFSYFYAESTADDGIIHIEIPAGTTKRDTLRRINALRVRTTALASDATDPGLGAASSSAESATATVVWLRNARFMPGAYDLLDPKASKVSQRPRNYLAGEGFPEAVGEIQL